MSFRALARHVSPVLFALALAAALGLGFSRADPPAPPTLVFVVRHAEKAANDPRDPDLSEEGRARATALARLLSSAGVTHLYSTELKRTRETLEPLSVIAKVPIETVGARQPLEQVAALKKLPPGSVAVVAGHSNTVPVIVKGLGGKVDRVEKAEYGGMQGEMLGEEEYGRLFLVAVAGEGVKTVELAYGR